MKYTQTIYSSLLLLPFLIGYGNFEAVAQSRVTGSVLDSDGNTMPTATVLILNTSDSSLVKGAVTDEAGLFNFTDVPEGSFLLKVTMIGFQTYHQTITIDGSNTVLDIGEIKLGESIQQMEQIVATARKSLYEQKIDRMVVNVQRDITSSGSSALEVLEKSPGVQVNRQSNDISLNGKSGVMVMVNGKEVRLPLESVITMLNGMSASNIEQIELMAIPPAKYDAEGDAGIINIKMKTYSDLGYTGSVGTIAGFNSSETLGGNFSFSKRKQNIAYFVNYSINYNNSEEAMFSERFLDDGSFLQTIRSDNFRDPTTTVQNMSLGFEYALSENTETEILLTGFRRRWLTTDLAENFDHTSPGSAVLIEQNIGEENLWNNGIINFGLNHAFTSDKNLSFDFDYLYYKNINPSTYQNRVISGDESASTVDAIDVTKTTPMNIWVSRLDYFNRLSQKLSFEMGLKGTFSDFFNRVRVMDTVDGNTILNSKYSNVADLNEFIGAGYISADISPSDQFTVNAGVRYEYVDRKLSSPGEGSLVDDNMGRFFPTFFMQRSFDKNNSLQFSYSRRTTRPTFWDLAPFVFFINPKTVLSGNADLKSAISDALTLGYSKDQFLVTLAYTHSQDEIARWQPSIDTQTNEETFSTQNLDYLDTIALTLNFPIQPFSWWNIQLSATGSYQMYRTSHLADNISGDAASMNGNVNNTFNLPRDYTVEASGYYQSETAWGVSRFKPLGSLNLGIQKKILDGNGTLRLSAVDILETNIWKGKNLVESADINSFWKYDFDARSVKLTFTWNFGSNEFENVNVKAGSLEEQERVGIN